MFIDYLEVDDNLRMSKKISNQDNGNKMENKLELVKPHKQKELALHANYVFCEQKDDQLSDVKEDGFTNLFSKNCNQTITNFVSGDFKKISEHLYMMNTRMITWIMYPNRQLKILQILGQLVNKL